MRESFFNKVQQIYVNVRSRTGNMSPAEIKTMTVRKLEDIKGVTKSRKLAKSKKAEGKTLIYEAFKKKIRATRTLHVHKNHIHRICIRCSGGVDRSFSTIDNIGALPETQCLRQRYFPFRQKNLSSGI